MPCNDVTERIEVVVDARDRLVSYTLRKRACGRAVGDEALLESTLAGKTLEEIAAITPDNLIDETHPTTQADAFLVLKHLFAVQAACAVTSGAAPGGPRDICAAAEITHAEGDTRLTGLIRVDVVHNEIKACTPCGRCPRPSCS